VHCAELTSICVLGTSRHGRSVANIAFPQHADVHYGEKFAGSLCLAALFLASAVVRPVGLAGMGVNASMPSRLPAMALY